MDENQISVLSDEEQEQTEYNKKRSDSRIITFKNIVELIIQIKEYFDRMYESITYGYVKLSEGKITAESPIYTDQNITIKNNSMTIINDDNDTTTINCDTITTENIIISNVESDSITGKSLLINGDVLINPASAVDTSRQITISNGTLNIPYSSQTQNSYISSYTKSGTSYNACFWIADGGN